MTRREEILAVLLDTIEHAPDVHCRKGVDAIALEDRLVEDLGIDSVGLLELVLVLERKLGVSVDDPAVVDGFRSLGAICDYVEAVRVEERGSPTR